MKCKRCIYIFIFTKKGFLPFSTSTFSRFECTLSFLGTCMVITLRQKGNNEKDLKRPPGWIRKYLRMDEMMTSYQCESCKHTLNQDKSPSPFLSRPCHVPSHGNLTSLSCSSVDYRKQEKHVSSLQLKELRGILRHVKLMASNVAEEIDENEIQMEWNYLAKMMDRTCRWLFLVLVALSHVALAVSYRFGNSYYRYSQVKACS